MNDTTSRLIERARAVTNTTPGTTYPSMSAAHRVRQLISELAEALVAAREEGRQSSPAVGWLYDSDDGPEWAISHPVETGEVPDARNIRPADATNLVAALKDAYGAYQDGLKSEASLHARLNKALEENRTRQSSPGPGVSEINWEGVAEARADTLKDLAARYNLARAAIISAIDTLANRGRWGSPDGALASLQNVRRALFGTATPEAPEPSPLSAEKIAEIIDPEAMRSAEGWYAYYREGYPDWSDDACADKAREVAARHEHFHGRNDAFAKAYAILALQAPCHQGVGDLREAAAKASWLLDKLIGVGTRTPTASPEWEGGGPIAEALRQALAQQPSPVSTREGLGEAALAESVHDGALPIATSRPSQAGDVATLGQITSLTTDEESGDPDVGLILGLGDGASLYVGELSDAYAGADHPGRWRIALHKGDGFDVAGQVTDEFIARELIDLVSAAIQKARSQDGTAEPNDRLREELDTPTLTPKSAIGEGGDAVEPPWPPGAGNNAKRAGWERYFDGAGRDACPFPTGRKDLRDGYHEGWDAAQASAPSHRNDGGEG